MRIAADTGGTFTDVVFEDDQGQLTLSKASTTPADPISGVLDAVAVAADEQSVPLEEFLANIKTFIHGTTHALNAVVTGNTAKTAFITTQGHGDILVYREGGRREPFNQNVSYPKPYIPRSLSFEVEERIGSDGSVVVPLDEASVMTVIGQLRELKVEAVAVCLLWSPLEQKHELRIGELLEQHLPGVPFTLSAQLNPILREYRRASAAAIDASLKPLMTRYIGDLTRRLTDLGFAGSVQILTSFGGVKMADEVARAPIQLLQSGPSMAPVAGRFYGCDESDGKDLIITDAGGTTYDVSLVREKEIIKTREYWIGEKFFGHVTGFPSVDVRSVGAGGGSIAWVDAGGVLHVGPQSQGADPGPACYKRGGVEATVTDAAVTLGYIDPDYFLGGRLQLDRSASLAAVQKQVGDKISLPVEDSAQSIMALATENMVQAIFDLAVERGIEPAKASMIGGGGAAGFNAIFIARRLNCRKVIFPSVGAVLSAAGAILSDMVGVYGKAAFVSSKNFDREVANTALVELRKECHDFAKSVGVPLTRSEIKYSVEARYKGQVWDIEVPLRKGEFVDDADLTKLVDDFHVTHQRIFAVHDPDSPIEILTWNAAISCRGDSPATGELNTEHQHSRNKESRPIHLPGVGFVDAAIIDFTSMSVDTVLYGPAIVESPFTSIVIDERASFSKNAIGSLIVELD
tara:strand:- start:4384 stop:6450 length:2067 start_codon:yes stop_codon:yes gene_type:complete